MKVSLVHITKLRQTTGAGVLACKKALERSNGDFAKAIEILKKEGLAKAAKKADRVTSKGIVETYSHLDGRIGVLVKLTCETDFVARNDEFKKLAHEICLQVAAMNPKNVKILLGQEYIREPGKKIDLLIKETIAKVGENIKVAEFSRIEV
jgi:elongation factor Ts